MDDEKRILEDIRLLDKNLANVAIKDRRTEKIIDLAKRYRDDAEYYLKKKDYVTAFGCINYAHGLVDALVRW